MSLDRTYMDPHGPNNIMTNIILKITGYISSHRSGPSFDVGGCRGCLGPCLQACWSVQDASLSNAQINSPPTDAYGRLDRSINQVQTVQSYY